MKWTNEATGRTIEIYNEDCMPALEKMQENEFDLAIVDPPYGIGDKFKGGKSGKMQFNEIVEKEWDKNPTEKYFNILFNKTSNQIIWGGNYFGLPPTRCIIIWDKLISEDFSLAMIEMAWTSFDKLAKLFRYSQKSGKVHPTQKPIKLYKWLLKNYAKENDRILDTHLGSGSIAIACWEMGFDLVGYELDEDYFKATCKRLDDHFNQQSLF